MKLVIFTTSGKLINILGGILFYLKLQIAFTSYK